MEKKYVILARNETTATKVSGLMYGNRLDEPNRTVYTGTDVMVLTMTALQFYLHTWVVLTPSKINPVNPSVVQTYFRLSVDCKRGISACTEDVRDAQEVV